MENLVEVIQKALEKKNTAFMMEKYFKSPLKFNVCRMLKEITTLQLEETQVIKY